LSTTLDSDCGCGAFVGCGACGLCGEHALKPTHIAAAEIRTAMERNMAVTSCDARQSRARRTPAQAWGKLGA
jgi:hypothetical protein